MNEDGRLIGWLVVSDGQVLTHVYKDYNDAVKGRDEMDQAYPGQPYEVARVTYEW